MSNIPFNRDDFSTVLKEKLSGSNVTLEFDNIQSTLVKVGVELSELLGKVYSKICNTPKTENDELQKKAHDYLQRSMLHLAIYQHTIFLIARIGNDGITVKKNEDETTIYKYQSEELKNELINTGWFWISRLIRLLNENADNFEDWKNSEEKKNYDAIPVKLSDFKKYVGVDSEFFMLNAGWIIREVWTDCVLSRQADAKKTDNIARAVCYEVMARACQRLAYHALPQPVRMDINNEMGKNHSSQEDLRIRESVSQQFQTHADAYWHTVELEVIREKENRASNQTYQPRAIAEDDSFVF